MLEDLRWRNDQCIPGSLDQFLDTQKFLVSWLIKIADSIPYLIPVTRHRRYFSWDRFIILLSMWQVWKSAL